VKKIRHESPSGEKKLKPVFQASTKKIYFQGLFGSLVNLVVVSLYSLLVVRLSLDYLGKEEFGLLSLISQTSTYIAVIDLGLFAAFSRILIDYTTGSRERYANALRTASYVFIVLGLLGFLAASLVAITGSAFLSIPGVLHKEFFYLMIGQGISLLFSFSLKPITAPLVANGKHYYIYWLNSGITILSALLFWLALRQGIGIYSSFIASFTGLLLNGIILWRLARPYLDSGNARGLFDRSIFREVVAFARDTMLWQIGGQTLAALPILLATAWFALGVTADLSGGMKLILLMISVCTRFGDMSVTPLSIQYANGNETAAASQMARIARFSGGISACAAVFIVCVNPAFIHWWMLDQITWSWHENLAGALWIAILSVTQCLYGYAVVCRRMGIIRWALLSECLIYIVLAFGLRSWAGSACLLWAKPVATLLITVAVAWRIKQNTLFDTRQLLPVFIRQFAALLLLFPPCLYFGRWIAMNTTQPLIALVASCLLSLLAMIIASPILFTREMRKDLYRILQSLIKRCKLPSTSKSEV
jgi:hypothetical protein